MIDDRDNPDLGGGKENSGDSDSAAETTRRISMAQARVLAMQAAEAEPGSYSASSEGVDMVFETVGQEEDDDYYHIRLSYRPVSGFRGEPVVEEFMIDKTARVVSRQIVSMPKPVRSQPEPLEGESDDELVVFPDKYLETVVRETLEKPSGSLTKGVLRKLANLNGAGRRIYDLTGLEHAVNLTDLSLKDNQITDISPLGSLIGLRDLMLVNNHIRDVSPLASLTNLTALVLNDNQISDLAPLASLTKLTGIGLENNQIRDVNPLASLTNMNTWLGLAGNQISDVSPLTSLTKLSTLTLDGDHIRDISPLASLTNLESVVGLSDNQLSEIINIKAGPVKVNLDSTNQVAGFWESYRHGLWLAFKWIIIYPVIVILILVLISWFS